MSEPWEIAVNRSRPVWEREEPEMTKWQELLTEQAMRDAEEGIAPMTERLAVPKDRELYREAYDLSRDRLKERERLELANRAADAVRQARPQGKPQADGDQRDHGDESDVAERPSLSTTGVAAGEAWLKHAKERYDTAADGIEKDVAKDMERGYDRGGTAPAEQVRVHPKDGRGDIQTAIDAIQDGRLLRSEERVVALDKRIMKVEEVVPTREPTAAGDMARARLTKLEDRLTELEKWFHGRFTQIDQALHRNCAAIVALQAYLPTDTPRPPVFPPLPEEVVARNQRAPDTPTAGGVISNDSAALKGTE